jgi:hypothetical protein
MKRSMETRGSINFTANRFDNVTEMRVGSEGKGRNSAFVAGCDRAAGHIVSAVRQMIGLIQFLETHPLSR